MAEKVVDAAARAFSAFAANGKSADADAAFANAFAATVAMAEADAERTWARDKKRATKMLETLGSTWKGLFRERKAAKGSASAKGGGKAHGLRRLEVNGVAALETYLGRRCLEKWGARGLTFDAVAAAPDAGKEEALSRGLSEIERALVRGDGGSKSGVAMIPKSASTSDAGRIGKHQRQPLRTTARAT